MTAIAGCRDLGGARIAPREACERALTAQRLYAPDPPSIWSESDVALGRALHPTLPEDAFDRGPVIDGAGRVLVADVRIDNRAQVCTALGLATSEAARLSDAQVLSQALAAWNVGAFDRLVADFAFAWWDPAARRLMLARDALGRRPLHYHRGPGFFAFASMPKGLHALPGIPRAVDTASAEDFLAHRPEREGASFFAGIARLPPRSYLLVEPDGSVALHRHWHPEPRPLRLPNAEAYAEALREHLDVAVAARLRGAEGAVAAHLSAGLDSSTVAATAARLLAPTGGRVTAYTAVPRTGFEGGIDEGGIVDEGPFAAQVAALYPNMDHVRIRTTGRSPLDGLDRMVWLYDRPLLNLCNLVWGDAIQDDAKARGLKVLLVGAMGNASFSHAGMERLTEMFATGRWFKLLAEGRALVRGGTRLGTVAAQAVETFLPTAVTRAIARLRRRGHDFADFSLLDVGRSGRRRVQKRPPRGQGQAQLSLLRQADYADYAKGVLGGWGIDLRDPTADRRLVEFCLSVPAEQFLADGIPRALARRAFADRLPPAVVDLRRQGYQAADWYEGLAARRAQLAEEIAHIGRDRDAASLLDLDRAHALIDDWPADDDAWRHDDTVVAYRYALLRGVSAGHFMRRVAGTN